MHKHSLCIATCMPGYSSGFKLKAKGESNLKICLRITILSGKINREDYCR